MSGKIVLNLGDFKNYVRTNLRLDPKYNDIKVAEEEGNLPETRGTISPRAAIHHKKGMYQEIVVYSDGTRETRIKPNLIEAFGNERGRVELELDQVEIARDILKNLRAVSRKVDVDPSSDLSEEEIMGPPEPPSRGGRKHKKIVKIIPC